MKYIIRASSGSTETAFTSRGATIKLNRRLKEAVKQAKQQYSHVEPSVITIKRTGRWHAFVYVNEWTCFEVNARLT